MRAGCAQYRLTQAQNSTWLAGAFECVPLTELLKCNAQRYNQALTSAVHCNQGPIRGGDAARRQDCWSATEGGAG